MSKYSIPSSKKSNRSAKLSQDDLRPNTTNNYRRPTDPVALMADANPNNYKTEERSRALRSLKNMCLDYPNKKIVWKDTEKKLTILRSAFSSEPEAVRIEALGIIKNMSLDEYVRNAMYTDPEFKQRILDAIRIEESIAIRTEGYRIMANLSISKCNRIVMYDEACWNLINISSMAGSVEMKRNALKTMSYLTLELENQNRLWEEFDMRRLLLIGASSAQPQGVREYALKIISNLVLNPKLGIKLWKSIAGIKNILLENASIDNKIAVQEYALCAIANLATFSTNQEAMFTCEVTRKQLSISADIKRASCVRRQALRTFRLCSENNDIKILMGDLWRKEKESLRWLANGLKKQEPNDIRIESITTIANIAEHEPNRQPMWRTEWLRDVVLVACQPVALPGIPTKNTPAIEMQAVRALGLLTGVDMA